MDITETVGKARAAGTKYKAALEKLIDYLSLPEQLLHHEAELLMTKDLIDMLQKQLGLITSPQSAR